MELFISSDAEKDWLGVCRLWETTYMIGALKMIKCIY